MAAKAWLPGLMGAAAATGPAAATAAAATAGEPIALTLARCATRRDRRVAPSAGCTRMVVGQDCL